MQYCEDCQVLSKDGESCPSCGGKNLRPVRNDDPILLLTVGGEESQRISAAFDDAGIPHMERRMGSGGYVSPILGQSRCSDFRIFVPYEKIADAENVLRGIGALKEHPPEDEKSEEIPESGSRRRARHIIIALMLGALICVAVLATDTLISEFKNFFH